MNHFAVWLNRRVYASQDSYLQLSSMRRAFCFATEEPARDFAAHKKPIHRKVIVKRCNCDGYIWS